MDNQQNKNKQGSGKNNKQGFPFIMLVALITTVLVLALYQFQGNGAGAEISYNEFMEYVERGKVDKVEIQSDKIEITMKKAKGELKPKVYYTGIVADSELPNKLERAKVEYSRQIPDTTSAMVMQFLMAFLPIIILVGLIVFRSTRKMAKGGGMMGIGKSNAKMYVEKQTGVSFRDVAGQDEAKESLQEMVEFLHNPGKYTSVGAKLPKEERFL